MTPSSTSRPTKIPYAKRTLRSPTAIIHLEYDPVTLEPVPSPEEWTRFVCISDTHSRNFDVPPGDVLLHSGDLTKEGRKEEFVKTMEWLYALPHKVKIIIAGNHDLTLDDDFCKNNPDRKYFGVDELLSHQARQEIKDMLKGRRAKAARIAYLDNEEYTFQIQEGRRTWSVYGSPWSAAFFNWAFNYERGEEAARLFATFPKTDILLTHGPAFGIFDRILNGDLVGCEDLLARLSDLRPRIHVAGHIHEAHGAHIHTWDPGSNYAPPRVQNDEDEQSSTEDLGLTIQGEDGGSAANSSADDPSPVEQTVFVNAANYPSGKKSWRGLHRVPFAGPGFQPVIVDLKDVYIPRSGL